MATVTFPTHSQPLPHSTPAVEVSARGANLPLDSQRAHPGDRVAFGLLVAAVALMGSMLVFNALASLVTR